VLSGRDNDDHAEEKYRFKFAADDDVRNWNLEQESRASTDGPSAKDDLAYWLRFSDIVNLDPLGLAQLRRTIRDKLSLAAECEARLEVNLSAVLYALSGNSELLKTQTVDSNLPAADQKRKSAFDILEIFVRINTQGMSLRRSDLIVSMLRLYWPSASTVLPSLIKEINTSSGLEIDTDFVIRCMFSTAGLGTRLEFDLLRKRSNVDALQKTYVRTFESIRSVIDFVRAECGLDSAKMVGGISTLIPFVHYVFHAPGHIVPKASIEPARRSLFLLRFLSCAKSAHGKPDKRFHPRSPSLGAGDGRRRNLPLFGSHQIYGVAQWLREAGRTTLRQQSRSRFGYHASPLGRKSLFGGEHP